MKRKFTLLLIGSFVFCLFFAGGYDKEDGKAGATGSPGENTCSTTNCHTGSIDNSQGGSVSIASDMTGWEYTPGVTYNISVTVAEAGVGLFGLGVEALKADGSNGGTLVPGIGTQAKNVTISGNSRENIVHLEDAGLSSDSHTFEFTWQAPAAAEGDITFYVAGNAANNNGMKTGDHIYTTMQVATAGPVGVAEMDTDESFRLFCNPAAQCLTIAFKNNMSGTIEVKLFSIDGKEVNTLLNADASAVPVESTFSLAGLERGSYLVGIFENGVANHFGRIVY